MATDTLSECPLVSRDPMSAIPEPINAVLQAQQQALRSQVAVSVERKRLDAAELQGAAVLDLLETTLSLIPSADPKVGRGFDAYA